MLKPLTTLFCCCTLSLLMAQTPIWHWETIVMADDQWTYLPAESAPPSGWHLPDFDDNIWAQGAGDIGYADEDDQTIIEPVLSLYLRIQFEIVDTANVMYALLHADYDDAFVAYLNGVEIARSNIGITGDFPAFDTPPTYFHEATMYLGGRAEYYEINKKEIRQSLREGTNTLAIQVLNDGLISSDLSAAFWLSVGLTGPQQVYRPTPQWFQEPVLLTTSNLPIFSIETNEQNILDDPRIQARLQVFNKENGQANQISDPATHYDGYINIEMRGSSSQTRFLKKSYGFETQDADGSNRNVELLGLPKENDWILYGPYSDKTLMRNDLLFHLGRQMGQYAPRTRFCELLINQKYQGVYVLMESIKRDSQRVDIAKLTEDDNSGDELTGGYILKLDKTTGAGGGTGFYSQLHPENYEERDVFVQYEYPEADAITAQQAAYIQDFFHRFEANLAGENFKDSLQGYRSYIDVASFIDFFLATELSYNADGYRLSTFLYKDKNSRDSLLHMGPLWDFNLSFGNGYDCRGQNITGYMKDFNKDCEVSYFQIPFWWDRLLEDVAFRNNLRCTWESYREGFLHTDSIFQYIDQHMALLQEAQQRNYIRWPVLELTLWPNSFHGDTYLEEVQLVKDWIVSRFDWLDDNLFGNCAALEIEDPAQLQTLLYPNPTAGQINLELYLPQRSKVNIQLYDVHGKLLQDVVKDEVANTGVHVIDLDWSDLPQGVYIISIGAVNQKQALRLVKI